MKAGFASLIGRPNAGKSTLLNHILGRKVAIVSDKPQTTRNRIIGVKNYTEGQSVFLDTPGIHRPLHRMNVRMVDVALESIREVDVLALVVDATERTGRGDRFVIDLFKEVSSPIVVVLNKLDLIAKQRLLPLMDWYRQQREFHAIIPISARVGDGVSQFEKIIIEAMPKGQALYPKEFVTDQQESVLAAEIVREQLLRFTRMEIPFSSTVVVDQFEERKTDGLLRIYCSVFIEQMSQKRIVVGRAGNMLKRIGTAARLELEGLFATKVFLDLHVKVKPKWRENDRLLDTLGLPRS